MSPTAVNPRIAADMWATAASMSNAGGRGLSQINLPLRVLADRRHDAHRRVLNATVWVGDLRPPVHRAGPAPR